MPDCIFCKIAAKESPSDTVYEDENVIAFKDLEPQAPVHVLVIPKRHIENIMALTKNDSEIVGHIFTKVVPEIAKKFGVESSGFRVTVNNGKDGGQTVSHIHFHILGGRAMEWPPG